MTLHGESGEPLILPPPYQHRLVPAEADDHLHDECGVFGIHSHPEATKLIYLGLYALQHRGQEGCGIACSDEGILTTHRGVGLVSDVFKPHKLARVRGTFGIGHVRYSTFGSSSLKNVQPITVDYARGSMAICHNGNLVNAGTLREELEEIGAIFQSTTDSEVIVHLISRSKGATFTDAVVEALSRVIGAYSVICMNEEELVAARDPHGFRPLWLGRLHDAWVVASETCALDIIDAKWEREIEPGEVVTINSQGIFSQKPFGNITPKQCVFEFIYVARPDSHIFGRSVDDIRKEMGRALARHCPAPKADVVMAVPDSSNPAALGYSHESRVPFDMGFIRNHYVGRTFIEPDQGIRDFGVKIKLNPARSAVHGKRIVLIDDSIVRGTTSKKIVKMLRNAGAKEIHFRVASPMIINSCHYGIDTPNREKLIAYRYQQEVELIRQELGVESLGYLPIDAMLEATGLPKDHFCLACFNNQYPTMTPKDFELRKQNHRHVDTTTEVYGL
jgi:amidophosphoribosyltransferase